MLIIGPQLFFSQSSPAQTTAHIPELIFHIINMSQDTSVSLLHVKLEGCIYGKQQQAPLVNRNTTSKILYPIVHVFVQLKLYSMRVELPAGTRQH